MFLGLGGEGQRSKDKGERIKVKGERIKVKGERLGILDLGFWIE